ncbi:MAG: sigma-70 family RNA polymerase sigma factor [Ardenticatenaceae bacterium]|nr:sigma-70 family RNA polymerase sigma factor [Ardenticatenaceae bacterium]
MSDSTTAVLPTEEHTLVTAATRADRAAFAQLYRAHVEAIYGYLYRRTGDVALAEDLTAATFEAAWRDIGRFEWRGVPFRAWLYRLAGTRLAMHRRRARLIQWLPLGLLRGDEAVDRLGAHPAADEHVEAADDFASLRRALARLSATDQEVLGLLFLAELPRDEVAAALGCSRDALYTRTHRALKRLRAAWNEETHG